MQSSVVRVSVLVHYKEEDMSLIMEDNIYKMTIMTTLTAPYPFHEIFHNQIAKWLFDRLKNSIFEDLNRHWAVGENLAIHVVPKEEVDVVK